MNLGKPASDLIRARTSIRKYQKEPLSADHLGRLADFLDRHTAGALGGRVRYRLLTAEYDGADNPLDGLGTYGFIANPAAFLIAAVERGAHDLEDFGYCMQRAILFATGAGIATCWLGGTFSRSSFSERIDLTDGERLPAVVSMGYATSRRGLLDRVVRGVAGSRKRKPFEEVFFHGGFDTPLVPAAAGAYAEPLEMVRLGPSASNKQPWRVVLDPDTGALHFFVFRLRSYERNLRRLQLDDLPRVDLGIAMCQLEASATENGLAGSWQVDDAQGARALPEHTSYTATWVPAARA